MVTGTGVKISEVSACNFLSSWLRHAVKCAIIQGSEPLLRPLAAAVVTPILVNTINMVSMDSWQVGCWVDQPGESHDQVCSK